MARQYDIVSRSRDYTVLNVIVGYENKAGKPALKKVKAHVPFFVASDDQKAYSLAVAYLSAGILDNVKGIDSVAAYVTRRFEMPFSEFAEHARVTETENEKAQAKLN